jgi:hypothetical protein
VCVKSSVMSRKNSSGITSSVKSRQIFRVMSMSSQDGNYGVKGTDLYTVLFISSHIEYLNISYIRKI